MDIHRCRFIGYPLFPINALAFTTPSLAKGQKTSAVRLAVGRANGDIEIWNPLGGHWHQEMIINGAKDRSIDGLVWAVEPDRYVGDGKIVQGKPRLFSIGYTSTVTEWDLEKRRPKRHATGEHGEIWCMALQPQATVDSASKTNGTANPVSKPSAQRLVVGTVSGGVALYSIEDDNLRFQRVIVKAAKKPARMLSVTFQSRHMAVFGCSDSCLRVYDIRNGRLVQRMTLGSDLEGGAKEILVWAVKCLPNGDIVSADSTGQICIWDGRTYTQSQRIESHKQDALSLAVSADGCTIVSGGMDRRTVFYKKTAGRPSRWARSFHRRYHQHDVKAMASFEGGGMSVVVTGGPDANLTVVPLREVASEHHRTLPLLSQIPAIQSAPLARLIVSWWERELQIWLLRKSSRELYHAGGLDGDLDKNRTRLATILIKGEFNITSAAISRDGSLLVVTTSTDVKVFAIAMPSTPLKKEELKISKVSVPDAVASSGASAVRISPDGAWICLIKEGNRPMLVRVRNPTGVSGSKPSLDTRPWKLRRLSRTAQKLGRLDGQQSYERTITQIAFSADSRVLAVADLAGFVDTWLLDRPQLDGADASADALPSDPSDSSSSSEASDDEQETTAKGPWIRNPKAALLPRLPAAPVVLSFSKHTPNLGSGPMSSGIDDDYTLVAITTSWHVLAFHPLAGTLTPWSRRNPRSRLPEQLLATRDLAKGVLWQGSRLWIYGISFLFMLDLSVDCIPEPSALPQPGDVTTAKRNGIDLEMPPPRSVKRKRGNESGAGNKMTAKESLEPRHVKVLDRGGWRDRTEDDDVAMRDPGCSDSDDEEEGGEFSNRAGELERLRYKEAVADSDQTGQQQLVAGQVQRPRWFQTFKYRPMVGIVELGGDEAATARLNGAPKGVKKTAGAAADDDDHMETMDTASTLPRLEVALVERPLWDAEMQPRLFGENEWER